MNTTKKHGSAPKVKGAETGTAPKPEALPQGVANDMVRGTVIHMPAPPRRAKGADVINPDTDISLEMVEQMIDEGLDVRGAKTMNQLAKLWASRPKLGRPTMAPRLDVREPRFRSDGTPGRRMARVVYDGSYTTSGIVLETGEDVQKNPAAKLFLRAFKKRLARDMLGRLRAKEKTVVQAIREILVDRDPGNSSDPGLTGPYKRWLSDAAQLEEFLQDLRICDMPLNVAQSYVLFRIQLQIKTQRADNPNPRLVDPATADTHVDTLLELLSLYYAKYGMSMPRLSRLKIKRKPPRWLNFWQFWKLVRYARGYVLDEHGRIIGRHGKAKKYACVVRYMMGYVFGGVRKGNAFELKWGADGPMGHMDVRNGEIHRQGPEARVTNKRRDVTPFIGSLRTLVPKWYREDKAARLALGEKGKGRFIHFIHDEEGYEVSPKRMEKLLDEICAAVGIARITSHVLKHTGVTLATRAYMPMLDVERAFSTSYETLVSTYRHLHWYWFSDERPTFRADDLNLVRLRKFSPMDMDEVYLDAA